MNIKPGQTYNGQFATSNYGTGALAAADSTPTVTVARNGTDDGAVAVTVTAVSTGRYAFSFTVPLTYAAGDIVTAWAAAAVAAVSGGACVASFVVDSKLASDVYTPAAAAAQAAAAVDNRLPASPAASGDVTAAVAPLATATGLAAAVAPLATAGGLTIAVAPLATVAEVSDIVDDIAEVAAAVAAVAEAVAGLAAGTGVGAIAKTFTVTTPYNVPIPEVDVWVTSDAGGTNRLASGRTDNAGQVTFYLDAGQVYFWLQKAGYNFTNPAQEVVS